MLKHLIRGLDRLGSGLDELRAKVAQEKPIEDSPIASSIMQATQFFEFIGRIADEATSGNTVGLAHVPAWPRPASTTGSSPPSATG